MVGIGGAKPTERHQKNPPKNCNKNNNRTHRKGVDHFRFGSETEADVAHRQFVPRCHRPRERHGDAFARAFGPSVPTLVVVGVLWPSRKADDVATPHHLLLQFLVQGDVYKTHAVSYHVQVSAFAGVRFFFGIFFQRLSQFAHYSRGELPGAVRLINAVSCLVIAAVILGFKSVQHVGLIPGNLPHLLDQNFAARSGVSCRLDIWKARNRSRKLNAGGCSIQRFCPNFCVIDLCSGFSCICSIVRTLLSAFYPNLYRLVSFLQKILDD